MADSAFGQYDWHRAEEEVQEAAELVYQARKKLHSAYALFSLCPEEIWQEAAATAKDLGNDAGNLSMMAIDLAHHDRKR